MEFKHISVMPEECIDGLAIKPDGVYVDATTGGAGHSALIASQLSEKGRLICIDRDSDALSAAADKLAQYGGRVAFVKSNFELVGDVVRQQGIENIDGILFDLGVSSYQLDTAERGFSYMQDAPLDMRMDRQQAFSAYDVINGYDMHALQNVISAYGEERFAYRIAERIVRERELKKIETTLQLSEIIRSAMPAAAKREKQHPAKRTFQAIRIEVNGELKAVERALERSIELLSKGGRIAVISFHSLEDRLAKKAFVAAATGCTCPKEFPVCICGGKPKIRLITKGALEASDDEIVDNPRSRSAKLRVAEKL